MLLFRGIYVTLLGHFCYLSCPSSFEFRTRARSLPDPTCFAPKGLNSCAPVETCTLAESGENRAERRHRATPSIAEVGWLGDPLHSASQSSAKNWNLELSGDSAFSERDSFDSAFWDHEADPFAYSFGHAPYIRLPFLRNLLEQVLCTTERKIRSPQREEEIGLETEVELRSIYSEFISLKRSPNAWQDIHGADEELIRRSEALLLRFSQLGYSEHSLSNRREKLFS